MDSMTTTLPKANVLLVDDRSENLLALESVLAGLGQNLVSASSAREALKFLLLEDVALILLDVQMPGLNGFELAELIRDRDRTRNTPIIFVTANTDNEGYKFRGYALGAVDYLTKPIDPEILKSKVSFFSKLFLQQQEIVRQATELEAANSRLDSLNSELEGRVRVRTAELEKANSELQFEVKERRESEARLATEHTVTRTLALAGEIDEAVPGILRAFIDNMGAAVAGMWQLAPGGNMLRFGHIEVAEQERGPAATFVAESRKLTFAVGVGFPGHVWNVGAPVWLPNTLHGDQFPRASVAASAGLHSAVGFPIKIGEDFFGIIEFYTRNPIAPSPQLTGMLEAIGSEIAQFVQRKRFEHERERLLQREKTLREEAERANRLKDDFLATVSHELRTPLNSILGWSQVVLLDNSGDEKMRAALETIRRNALSQAQLIEDLLDASRLITGKLTLELSPTDPLPVLEAAVDAVRPAAEAKGLTLEIKHKPEPVTITCDPNRLQQMVWNLVTNAVKFTSAGGKVTVAYEDRGNSVQLVVADTGVGISPEFLPFVFDRFRQQDSSSTRRHQGLGLGLAIVKHLAELHGGSVSVTSDGEGLGSAFTISLPTSYAAGSASENKAPKSSEPPAQTAILDGVKILVVDDDADAREMLEFALKRYGADVAAAGSAEEALRSLSARPPDVLLADINMPDEDGYSLIKKIRSSSREATANVLAVAVTALARPEDADRALASGFQVHLAKPFDISELAGSINRLISESHDLDRTAHARANESRG
jgi:signal transduction histidine kinase